MKILFYCINFSPDLIGIPKYNGEMCDWLTTKGHQITVITGKPYYPEWQYKAHESYKHIYFTEYSNNITIHRCPIYIPAQSTAFKKILHECSFLLSSCYVLVKNLFTKYDALIVIAPPFHLGLIGYFFSKINQVPIIYHIQDLQVDIVKDLKMIKNPYLLSILESAERFILSKVAIVTTISEGMKNKLLTKGAKIKHIALFPNWVDTDFIRPISKENSLREELGFLQNDFIVLYAGNMGEKQGLEYVIEAAELLKNDAAIKFILVGDGGGKQALIHQTAVKKLTNIHFFPLQPYEKLPQLLATGDVHLVLQKKEAADLVLPSKLTGILAVGGIAIATANKAAYLYQEMTKHDLGIVIEPENALALSEAILAIKNNSINSNHYKTNALQYAKKYLQKEHILSNFEKLLTSINQQ